MSGCITIYTDASVCPKSKTGGWACWVKFGKFETLQASGFFKEACDDSTDAELRAIANALTVVVRRLRPTDAILVVVTDSLQAQMRIQGKIKQPNKGNHRKEKFAAFQSVVDHILALIPDGCELRVNKVKAHARHDGARSYVNNLVDKAARKEMRRKRNQLTYGNENAQ